MKRYALSLVALSLIGCQNPNPEISSPVNSSTLIDYSFILPNGQNIQSKGVLYGEYILTQGDILIPVEKIDLSKQSLTVSNRTDSSLWPEGKVYYTFDAALTSDAKQDFLNAIKHWEAKTSIRFFTYTNQDHYILVKDSTGCSSAVGMQNKIGAQTLSLSRNCGFGAAVHEIGHAVGLWHEQSRPDRDNYVTVQYDNITSASAYNFDKAGADGTVSGSYDFGSIMHYDAYAFSKNKLPTIIPKDKNRSLDSYGQRDGLSSGDIAAIEALYQKSSLYSDWWSGYGTTIGNTTKAKVATFYNNGAFNTSITSISASSSDITINSATTGVLAPQQQGTINFDVKCGNTVGLYTYYFNVKTNNSSLKIPLYVACFDVTNSPIAALGSVGENQLQLVWYSPTKETALNVIVKEQGSSVEILNTPITQNGSFKQSTLLPVRNASSYKGKTLCATLTVPSSNPLKTTESCLVF